MSDIDEFSVESVYGQLLSRAPENKMEARMEPMWRAMELLGEPNTAFPVVHLTGTNGKTSTARMIEQLFLALGLRTGRYTSPHLSRVTERISIDGSPVSDETFVRVWDEISPILDMVDAELVAAGQPRITYFEALTILGIAIFADAPVDVAVIEVGLGGITDATNVMDGKVSVVTPISLDHTDLLGDTVEDIAAEKAGIVKPAGYLVSAVQPVGAAEILLEKSTELGVPHAFESVDFGVESRLPGVGGQQITVDGLAGRYTDILLPLLGEHQAQNAATAIAAVEAFIGGGDTELDVDAVREAMRNVTSPGRLEVVRTAPTMIVDAAHNEAGARATARAIAESFDFSALVLVIGILQEKDPAAIFAAFAEELGDLIRDVVVTQSSSPRAISAEDLVRFAVEAGFPADQVQVAERLDTAIETSVQLAEATGDLASGVLITGSITVVGEARTLLVRPGEDS